MKLLSKGLYVLMFGIGMTVWLPLVVVFVPAVFIFCCLKTVCDKVYDIVEQWEWEDGRRRGQG